MLQKNIINETEIRDYYWSKYQNKLNKATNSLLKRLKERNSNEKLPTVRINRISLKNLKNVSNGEIVFYCGKKHIPYATMSDILGLYGQNGSGKTTLINALEFVRMMLIGVPYNKLSQLCYGFVNGDAEFATIRTDFDLQYPDGRIRRVVYEFSIKDEVIVDGNVESEPIEGKLRILNERISMGGDFYGKKHKLQPIIDTTNLGAPFASITKKKEFVGSAGKSKRIERLIKESYEKTGSFVFSKKALNYYRERSNFSEYYQVLVELKYFALFFFFVIGTQLSGFMRMNIGLVISTMYGDKLIYYNRPNIIVPEGIGLLEEHIGKVSLVMEQLIPGMKLRLIKKPLATVDGDRFDISLNVIRNGFDMPIRYESDGIRRLVSVMSLYIWAFSCQSCTIAIDEFDAGIFEYLLGELLELFQESGKGQLIFTAHNLRALEVLNREFLYFTTTNPKKRYTQLTHIGKTNNLRNAFFREIVLGSGDEIYSETKKRKILQALYEAEPNEMKEDNTNG